MIIESIFLLSFLKYRYYSIYKSIRNRNIISNNDQNRIYGIINLGRSGENLKELFGVSEKESRAINKILQYLFRAGFFSISGYNHAAGHLLNQNKYLEIGPLSFAFTFDLYFSFKEPVASYRNIFEAEDFPQNTLDLELIDLIELCDEIARTSGGEPQTKAAMLLDIYMCSPERYSDFISSRLKTFISDTHLIDNIQTFFLQEINLANLCRYTLVIKAYAQFASINNDSGINSRVSSLSNQIQARLNEIFQQFRQIEKSESNIELFYQALTNIFESSHNNLRGEALLRDYFSSTRGETNLTILLSASIIVEGGVSSINTKFQQLINQIAPPNSVNQALAEYRDFLEYLENSQGQEEFNFNHLAQDFFYQPNSATTPT